MNLNHDIIICGHRNPDTDSVCSAYALERYKTLTEPDKRYIAVRCGHMNPQTRYIFSSLQVTPPPHLKDIHRRISDFMSPCFLPNPYVSIAEAVERMSEAQIRMIPVADEAGNYLGSYTLHSLTEFLINDTKEMYASYQILMPNLVKLLQAEILQNGEEESLSARFLIGSMDEKTFEEYLQSIQPRDFFLIIGGRPRLIQMAMDHGFKGIIITGNQLRDISPKELSPAYSGWIIRSQMHSEHVIRICSVSASIQPYLRTDIQTISPDDLLEETKEILEKQHSLPVVDPDNKLLGMVKIDDLLNIPKPQLVLVDHNEERQSILGHENAEIVEIVDHHRLAPRPTKTPINFTAAPVGSTCTLVSEMFSRSGTEVPIDVAKILLAGIISDTVVLRSPTTTQRDRDMVARLSEITRIDPAELGEDIYTNGSMLKGMSIEKIITNDFKEFKHGSISFGIGQVEVVNFKEIESIQDQLIEALEKVAAGKYTWALLLITNINKGDSILLSSPYEKGKSRLGYEKISENVFDLPQVMSRKKQLLPEVIEALSRS